ncbi:hypothetical protein [uncultured Phycicoccus sp.]|uniref:hypothetical protein n=1 Tax=uncultured Phycicoccus sp. TaxID=661422 RepID=UPI00262A0DA9|nr:hypothetical protein [uncultured Phycicoccus sp.]
MTGQRPRRPDEAADFGEFAAARQGPALRAAVLVTGDRPAGERVALGALVAVAAHWAAAREDGPDRWLRRVLYRDAVSAATAARVDEAATDGALHADPDTDPDDIGERRDAVRAALAGLEPRRRAVAVLRWLDERTEAETAEALAVPAEEVAADLEVAREALTAHGALHLGGRAPSDGEARDLLELVADEVPDLALAAPAWAAADERHRTVRRRVVVGGGVAVAGAVAAMALTGGDEPLPLPRPSTGPSTADGRLPEVSVAGVRILLAPDPQGEPLLPLYPDAPRLALSPRLGPGVDRPLQILSPAGSTASVRAVYLIQTGADAYRPALSLPRQTAQVQLVAMAPLRPTVLGDGTSVPRLGPRTIDADRHRLVFPQPGAVVVLEVRSARTRRIPVDDDGLVEAGWATDGLTVVARSAENGWLVDSRSGEVTRASTEVHAGWADIAVAPGRATVRTFSGSGRITGARELTGPDLDVYGPSISNIEGWACRATYFGAMPATRSRMQGLVAVQGDLRPSPRILAAAPTSDVPLGAYRPLAWGPRDTVLLESRSVGGVFPDPATRVLAWDVITDRLYRVGEVDRPHRDAPDEQGFTGVWAL